MQGGWFPLLLGLVMFIVMSTWHRGRELMLEEARTHAGTQPLPQYLDTLFAQHPMRAPGTAVFLNIDRDMVPHALVNNLEHNHVVHQRVVFLHVANEEVPYVAPARRVAVEAMGRDCYRVTVTYGFKDIPNLPQALAECAPKGLTIDPAKVSYFLSHATVVATGGKGMWLWRERLFGVMSHNIGNVAAFFKLPASRVIEVGSRVEI
jgi:KUP system potassium uptake protein